MDVDITSFKTMNGWLRAAFKVALLTPSPSASCSMVEALLLP